MNSKRRKLTDEEKAWRRHQRRADRENAKAIAESGMFAAVPGEVQEVTADDMWRRWRANVALGVERIGHVGLVGLVRPLAVVLALHIEQYARQTIGSDFDRVRAHALKTYGASYWQEYAYGFWQELLTGGKEIVFSWRAECRPEWVNENNKDGRRTFPDEVFPPRGWMPPLTREQFWELFPYRDPEPGPEPDDGGLFDRVMALIDALHINAVYGQVAQERYGLPKNVLCF